MRFTIAILAAVLLAGCSSNASTTPTCAVSAISISGAPATLTVGATATLTANVTQQNCTSVALTWGSSNIALLTVDQSGHVTGVAAGGPVTITVSGGGQSGTAQITVAAVPVAIVNVAPDSIVVGAGGTFLLAATTRAIDSSILTGRVITWSSAANATAMISAAGLVAAVAPGTTTMTATSETKTGTSKVFVATPRLVFFWNNVATTAGAVVPDFGYSYSLGAGANSVTSTSVGNYALTYANFARTGAETEALFITPYSAAPGTYCGIGGWSTESASTTCSSTAGTPLDSRFDFLALTSGTFAGRYAYAWVDNASPTTPVAPHPQYRFSSSNQAITVTKAATGVYSVLFAGQGRLAGTDRDAVIVSAYGNNAFQCQPSGWTSSGADLTALVYCFNGAGVATDSRFDIALISQPRAGATLGYLDADQPGATGGYSPTNSKVMPTGTVTVTRSGVGTYSVRLDGLFRSGSLRESFQINAVGTTAIRCQSAGWGYDVTGVTSFVSCANPAGVATDSRFVMLGVQ